MESHSTSRWREELIAVTLEQLQLANTVAHAAAHGQMPRKSFKASYEEAKEAGEIESGSHLVLTDDPMNHAAMAIMETFNPDRSEEGTSLAVAIGLDMRAWWQPTRENFLKRLTKNEILAAVSEGVSQQASWRLAPLKKDRMAKEAEKLLASSKWLPLPLRVENPGQIQATN